MIGQLILSLSILVVLHELGHFIPARLFNTRVEKFYLFFDPWFSLFKFKKGDTEYGIGWLPLGGYVKIAGMIDESMDTEQMQQAPQPWEFRSKPAWQRLIIMLGGVTVNVILGCILFGMIKFVWGETYLPNQNVSYGIAVDSLGMQLGLENGDKIVSIDGKAFERFSSGELSRNIIINDAKNVEVDRNGQKVTLPINEGFIKTLTAHENKGKSIFNARMPFVIGNVVDGYPAADAGLEVNDSIVSLNGETISFYDQFAAAMAGKGNETIALGIVRNGQNQMLNITTNENGKIGVNPYGPDRYFDLSTIKYSFFESIPKGIEDGFNFLDDQFKAFGQIFSGKINAKDSVGGFVSITQMFGEQWIWQRFWTLTASLSMILAIMNLLPIPALDGGHVMFLLYEIVSGRKPSDKFMEYATLAGFIIVLALMLYVNGLDIMRGCF